MMQDTAAGQHAARRDDDHRTRARINALGVRWRAGVLRGGAQQLAIRVGEAMVVFVAAKETSRVDRHGTIEKYRQIRNSLGGLELGDETQEVLSSTHGECRNQDDPAFDSAFVHHPRKYICHRLRWVSAISIC